MEGIVVISQKVKKHKTKRIIHLDSQDTGIWVEKECNEPETKLLSE